MKTNILLVEDEADLALIIADTLRSEGYDVTAAADGIDGLAKFKASIPDIVIADVMMPRMDGFAMAREMRSCSASVPLLFLTAKGTVDDVERGFESGASDYLRKPFELRELIVRLRALLKRFGANRTDDVRHTIGAYTFNVTTQTLSFGNRHKELSHFEARLLTMLAANRGHTVDASSLMMELWQRDDPSNRNSLHGYIHKLRRALRHDPAISIINQRGFGYMLAVKE